MSEQTYTPTGTKYEAKFIRWMEIGKYHLVDGEFVELRRLSEEEMKTLYSRFIDSTTGISPLDSAELIEPSEDTIARKLDATLSALKNLQVHYLEVNEQVLQLQAELFKANEKSEEHEKQRDFWHFEAQREHKDVEDFTKAYSRAIQFIYYMSKRLGLPLSERLLASKDLILNLKEKVDNFIKEEMEEEPKPIELPESKPFLPTVKNVVVNPNMSLDIFFNEQELLPINVELELRFQEPQATKYPFDFVEWMKTGNYHLNNGKFFADDLVMLSDEQVNVLWDRFIDSSNMKPFEEQSKDLPELKAREAI